MQEKRDQTVLIRLTDSEKTAATVAADRYGITLSTWVRFHVRRALGMPAPGGLEHGRLQAAGEAVEPERAQGGEQPVGA